MTNRRTRLPASVISLNPSDSPLHVNFASQQLNTLVKNVSQTFSQLFDLKSALVCICLLWDVYTHLCTSSYLQLFHDRRSLFLLLFLLQESTILKWHLHLSADSFQTSFFCSFSLCSTINLHSKDYRTAIWVSETYSEMCGSLLCGPSHSC